MPNGRAVMIGSATVNVAPCPSPGLDAWTSPPWRSTSCWTMARPSPSPPWARAIEAVRLAEWLEDPRQRVRRDADSRVADRDDGAGPRALQPDAHAAASRRELRRIRQEVREDLRKSLGVAPDGTDVRLQRGVQRDLLSIGRRANVLERGEEDGRQLDGSRVQPHAPGGDPGEVEQVLDELGLVASVSHDRGGPALDDRRVVRVRAQQVAPTRRSRSAACAARGTAWRGTRPWRGWPRRLPTGRCRSRRRSSSRSSSMRFRGVMSRAIFEAPMMRPWTSFTGETVTETSIRTPSFRSLTVSKWSTTSPSRIRLRISVSSCWRSGGMMTVIGPPDDLPGLVAEDPLGGRVPGLDPAVEVLAHDRVLRGLDDRGEVEAGEVSVGGSRVRNVHSILSLTHGTAKRQEDRSISPSRERPGARNPRRQRPQRCRGLPHGAKCSPSPSDRNAAIWPRVSGASGQKLPPPQPLVIPERTRASMKRKKGWLGRHVRERRHGGRGADLERVEESHARELNRGRWSRKDPDEVGAVLVVDRLGRHEVLGEKNAPWSARGPRRSELHDVERVAGRDSE